MGVGVVMAKSLCWIGVSFGNRVLLKYAYILPLNKSKNYTSDKFDVK